MSAMPVELMYGDGREVEHDRLRAGAAAGVRPSKASPASRSTSPARAIVARGAAHLDACSQARLPSPPPSRCITSSSVVWCSSSPRHRARPPCCGSGRGPSRAASARRRAWPRGPARAPRAMAAPPPWSVTPTHRAAGADERMTTGSSGANPLPCSIAFMTASATAVFIRSSRAGGRPRGRQRRLEPRASPRARCPARSAPELGQRGRPDRGGSRPA